MSKRKILAFIGTFVVFSVIVIVATNNLIEYIQNLFPLTDMSGPNAILLSTILIAWGLINYKIFEKLK